MEMDRDREDNPERELDILGKTPLLVLKEIVPFSCNMYIASL